MSHGGLSDDRLARAAAHGEPGAFAEVYSRHSGALYGYLLSTLNDPEEARDALQNTMEKAYGAISSQRVTGGLRAWLFGIAHNEAISLVRRRPATQVYGDELALAAAPAGDPADRERLGQLLQDLKTLPEQQRSALVLRELSGLASDEIGSALGISPAAAKQAVYEARATLLAQSGGRDMDCRQVQMNLSEADGRRRRGRRLKAHLADCALCTAFAAAIPARSADMHMLFPPLGAAVAAKTLAAATAGGGAAAGGKGGRAQLAGAGALAAVIAAIVVGALAVGSPESDSPTPPRATPAPAPQAEAKAKAAPSPPAAEPTEPAGPTEPAADTRPPAAVSGYTDLDGGVLGNLGGGDGDGSGDAGSSAARSGDAANGDGSLPFTGLELALLGLAGAGLLVLGAGLRRIST